MNGPHDLGGRHGFGPIAPEADEPLFHAPWERRALALTLAAGAMGHWSIDESRAAREDRHPADYYGSSYYEIWTKGLETLLLRHGLISYRELRAGRPLDLTVPPNRVLKADAVAPALAKGSPANRDPEGSTPAFTPGDRIRTLNLQPRHHIRLPAYAREKTGIIERVQGFHVFADASAKGDDHVAHWLYTVVFDAFTLWGGDASPDDTVSIDAWEPYLEHA